MPYLAGYTVDSRSNVCGLHETSPLFIILIKVYVSNNYSTLLDKKIFKNILRVFQNIK
jgi:hypothetical protein